MYTYYYMYVNCFLLYTVTLGKLALYVFIENVYVIITVYTCICKAVVYVKYNMHILHTISTVV